MLGKIMTWNGYNNLQIWPNKRNGQESICNMVNGSDGTVFRPYQQPNQKIYSYTSDVCRFVNHFNNVASWCYNNFI